MRCQGEEFRMEPTITVFSHVWVRSQRTMQRDAVPVTVITWAADDGTRIITWMRRDRQVSEWLGTGAAVPRTVAADMFARLETQWAQQSSQQSRLLRIGG